MFNPDLAGAWAAISSITGVILPALGIVLGLGLIGFAIKSIRDTF